MTTIAYDGKIIAFDSRECFGDMICNDDINKAIESDGKIFILSGSSCDTITASREFKDNEKSSVEDINIHGFLCESGIVYEVGTNEKGRYWKYDSGSLLASSGSGKFWAMAAMDFGKNAIEAVKYAMTRDSKSGGKVRYLDIATMKIKVAK